MNRRPVRFKEILAIEQSEIRADDDSIFILFSPAAPENEYDEDAGVACVHVRGPLDHHAGFGDNYDDIRQRAREAFECEGIHTVIFKLDSPGGAVSGLIDTVRAIRGMSEASDKRTIAYVDERAFSAAYALACACDEIVLPESGLTGSIGVISTMADQVELDRRIGLNFVTITSGARKADGHIHVPISEDAVAAEQTRVDKLAKQFFGLVREARGLSMKAIAGFEAGLFLGADAVKAGVADRVATFDQLLDGLGNRVTHSGTTVGTSSTRQAMKGYRTALLAQLKEARTALASAKPAEKPKLEGKIAGYEAALEAYKKVTEKHVEHSKTHEEDEDDDEGGEGNETDRGDSEEEDEDKGDEEAAGASGSRKASGGKRKARMADEEEGAEGEGGEEDAAYEDDEEEAKALAGIVQRATGKTGVAARGALAGLIARANAAAEIPKLRKRLAAVEARNDSDQRGRMIDAALRDGRISPHQAKGLRTQETRFVKAFLDMQPKAMVRPLEEVVKPKGGVPNAPPGDDGSEASAEIGHPLDRDQERLLDMAMASIEAQGGKITREQLRKQFAIDMNGARDARLKNGAV